MKPIYTREQLISVIDRIIDRYCGDWGETYECATEIVDLIADLGCETNDLCFHSKESDDRR